MHTLHLEEVDPFISLAMLRDYLSLAEANQLVEMSRLDQISLCRSQLSSFNPQAPLSAPAVENFPSK